MNSRLPEDLLDDLIDHEDLPLVDGDLPLDLLAGEGFPADAPVKGISLVTEPDNNNPLGLSDIASDADDDTMVLTLDDLFPDENGEVVISSADGVPINLVASLPVDQSGVAEPHVTAAGIDVSGLNFRTFESGLTVYFEADSLIQITDDTTV